MHIDDMTSKLLGEVLMCLVSPIRQIYILCFWAGFIFDATELLPCSFLLYS